jgi:hypothetical protein
MNHARGDRYASTVWDQRLAEKRHERAAGGESQARFTAQFAVGVVSLTIPLRPVLVDGSSRRCSWTGSPSTNWRLHQYARSRLNKVSERFPQISEECFILGDRFSGPDGH